MTKIGDAYRKVRSLTSERPSNFGWVLEGKLAGSGLPISKAEFEWVCSEGICAVVTVREVPLSSSWIDNGKIDYLHLQVNDFDAPDIEEIDRATMFIEFQLSKNRPVMVHCAAGKGRTGVILAAYLIKKERLSAKESIERIRTMRPGSIQSDVQEWAIEMYEKFLKNKMPQG